MDSGNLAGQLLALKNGCEEALDAPLFSYALVQNLHDLIELMQAELAKLVREHMRPLQATQRATLDAIAARVEAISVQAQRTPKTLADWVLLTRSLMQPASDLATETRRLASSLAAR